MSWHVYIILCTDGTLYTGITTDVARRLRAHAAGKGAKYFRARHPEALVYLETGPDRSWASKREFFIKGLSRGGKEELIARAATPPVPLPA